MSRSKSSWRQNLRNWWQDMKWPVLIALAFFALALGYVGFARYAASQGESASPLDLLYQTLQLISMNSGLVPGPINWQLQVARFLIPALTVYTALTALALIFSEQMQVFKLWRIKDHVIICGLGRKGALLVEQFRDLDMDVVVLEQDGGNDWLEISRELGAVVLVGDASDPELLNQAKIDRAKYLIAVMGDDGANAEVAVRAEELMQGRITGVLTCLIHIVSPQLYDLLREKELGDQNQPGYRLELFNIYDRGARLILQSVGDRVGQVTPSHILVVGMGKLGESVVLHAIKQWREDNHSKNDCLQITIIDRDAQLKAESLCVRFRQLEQVCNIVPLQMEVNSPDFLRAEFLRNPSEHNDVKRVYVCLDDDSLGLHAGLSLLQQMKTHKVAVVIRMVEDTGLATLLGESNTHQGSFKNLHAFGLLNQTCTADLILGGTHELLARDLHSIYLSDHVTDDEKSVVDEALVPWAKLPGRLKESNRRQAGNIVKMLNAGGYKINPLRDWDASELEISPQEEVETMARIEHERWYRERIQDGWVYGLEKDADKKTNPDLVEWDDLPEEEKEKNRRFVRGLPRSLARAGFQIERLL
jgi:predicted Fe-Mo cluster-binding NifX family protein